ncbi:MULTISPECIES: glycosyltransferase family A protein [unclassified Rhizobium]|uniref:glycosyltransferase family A protein n=1 Tax=unclassified Rhizobium TaxID=2613769 RepID=UPI0007895AD2|nr:MULTISPECIES: glycosyltransferase family A protein [unclassified Rhizobium]
MTSIDVVIPNYNYGRYLAGCVGSVLDQDIDELRILIIDNASSDDSASIARALARRDSRIELRLRPSNLGAHASFNEGIDWAQADYLLILCADDLLVPGTLKEARRILDRAPSANLAYGRSLLLHDGETLAYTENRRRTWDVNAGSDFLKMLCFLGKNPVSGPTVLVRTVTQKQVGHYTTRLSHTDDLEMWMRFALTGDIASTGTVQAIARVHGSSRSARVRGTHLWNRQFEAAFRLFFYRAGASCPDAASLLRIAEHAISDRAYWSALRALIFHEPDAGRLFFDAIRLRPTAAVFPPLGYLAQEGRLKKALSLAWCACVASAASADG